MLGAIIGDIIGSVYEWENVKSEDFALFSRFSRITDDTVTTVAVADAILTKLSGNIPDNKRIYAIKLKEYGRKYPNSGYGHNFERWLLSDSMRPYQSYGNGSAMRVSPVGFAFVTLDKVLKEAKQSAEVTHNSKEGIKGAQAVASAIFLARTGEPKETIKRYIENRFGYNLSTCLDKIRKTYQFDVTCQGSVPQAITAFLESKDYEDTIRKAISIGGDSDTIACIAGGIAEAFYKEIPAGIISKAKLILDCGLKEIIDNFYQKYMGKKTDNTFGE